MPSGCPPHHEAEPGCLGCAAASPLTWEKLLKMQILLGVVRQPCVNVVVKVAVLLPVADSVAGGHFLSLLHFPSCKNSLMGKPQARVSQESIFPLLYGILRACGAFLKGAESAQPVTGARCGDVPTAIAEERAQGAFLSCSAVG